MDDKYSFLDIKGIFKEKAQLKKRKAETQRLLADIKDRPSRKFIKKPKLK